MYTACCLLPWWVRQPSSHSHAGTCSSHLHLCPPSAGRLAHQGILSSIHKSFNHYRPLHWQNVFPFQCIYVLCFITILFKGCNKLDLTCKHMMPWIFCTLSHTHDQSAVLYILNYSAFLSCKHSSRAHDEQPDLKTFNPSGFVRNN